MQRSWRVAAGTAVCATGLAVYAGTGPVGASHPSSSSVTVSGVVPVVQFQPASPFSLPARQWVAMADAGPHLTFDTADGTWTSSSQSVQRARVQAVLDGAAAHADAHFPSDSGQKTSSSQVGPSQPQAGDNPGHAGSAGHTRSAGGTPKRPASPAPTSSVVLSSRGSSPVADLTFGARVAQTAQQFIGVPYRWGGTSDRGFDCSGLVQYTLARVGVHVGRTSYDQYQAGQAVKRSDLEPGDLVFFNTDGPGASHVGIYIGNGRFINATPSGVRTDSLSSGYWAAHYLGARRVHP
ncbi:C40 family peptidase [Alicyclobacillus macrosporangiidus]|uniref:C40 family peptidase n=1 Tax=Alicyclobacillus macrosporangiidus TaxID=392015 RepID=UPI0009DE79B3|nr:C40 family peptidase [Alicyclobacillus macrosporangiidus]